MQVFDLKMWVIVQKSSSYQPKKVQVIKQKKCKSSTKKMQVINKNMLFVNQNMQVTSQRNGTYEKYDILLVLLYINAY